MANTAEQRKNMVESQVRASDVTDRRIIAALLAVAREEFVPEAMRSLAYMDGRIRIAGGTIQAPARTLLEPRVLAKLLDLARIEPNHRVLVAGAGSGYSAAIISRLAREVVALECDNDLAAKAERGMATLGYNNVKVERGVLSAGWEQGGPYDVILLEGAVCDTPGKLLASLAQGGRLVGVSYEDGAGKAAVWQRSGDTFNRRLAFDAAADILPGFEKPRAFQL